MSIENLMAKLGALGCKGHPTSAHFELTHRCNGSCAYCYLTGMQKPDLPLNDIQSIITRLKENGILYLYLTGGEPFIRGDITKIIEHAVTCDFFEINLLSNGTLIDNDYVNFLSSYASHIKKIQFSVFSDIPEENDTYLGISNATRKTLGAAESLMRAGMHVTLSLNATSFNVDRIGAIMDYYENLGYAINFSPHTIITQHNKKQFGKQDSYLFYKRLFTGLGEERRHRFSSALRTRLCEPKRTTLCSGRLCMITVNPQGTVYPCPSFRNYPLGNLLTEPDLHTIYSSDTVHRLHQLSLEDYVQCRDCRYVNFCSICIGRWHTRFGVVGTIDDQLCNYVKALADSGDG